MEIYSAIKKVQACEEQRDLAKKAVDEVRPKEQEFADTEKELIEFRKNLTDVSMAELLNHRINYQKLL